jgi:hypothetical protein
LYAVGGFPPVGFISIDFVEFAIEAVGAAFPANQPICTWPTIGIFEPFAKP